MKIQVTESLFRQRFVDYGRESQFSYEALGALFEHLEEIEDATGEETNLDVIGICCDFSEFTREEITDELESKGFGPEDFDEEAEDWDEIEDTDLTDELLSHFGDAFQVNGDSWIVTSY